MLVYNQSQVDPIKILSLIKSGSILCYPTETLYGLGCSADNKDAIKKIYEIKKREEEKNFTLLFKDLEMIKDFCNLEYYDEELITKSIDLIKSTNKASTSFLQRNFQIGYNKAARIMETLEERGVVSEPNHTGKRNILINN